MTPASTFVRAPWRQPQIVSSVLVDGPAVEPLTLDEAKARAGLYWVSPDPRDDLMTAFIKAARQQVEQDTGLALLTQTRAVTFTWNSGLWGDAPSTPYQYPLPMQALPLQSIVDADGNPVDPATYTVNPSSWTLTWGYPTSRPFTIVSGWPSVDALKAEAPLLYHAVGLLTAHYATVGRDLATTGTIITHTILGYEDAIAPYRLIWVT